jgi:hypothetical protein
MKTGSDGSAIAYNSPVSATHEPVRIPLASDHSRPNSISYDSRRRGSAS